MLERLITYQQAVVAILVIGPMLMSARFFAVAAWGEPNDFRPFDAHPQFMVPYILAGLGCIGWALHHNEAWSHAYLGASAALLSMVRAVSIARGPATDPDRWVSVITWGTISVMALLIAILGVEYVAARNRLLQRMKEDVDA